jgi:hypothetical protein
MRLRKTAPQILTERDRLFSRCTPRADIARCAKSGCSDAETIRAAMRASYLKAALASVRHRTRGASPMFAAEPRRDCHRARGRRACILQRASKPQKVSNRFVTVIVSNARAIELRLAESGQGKRTTSIALGSPNYGRVGFRSTGA